MSTYRPYLGLMVAALLVLLALTACISSGSIKIQKTPDGGITIEATAEGDGEKEGGDEDPPDANSIFETREVDASLLANNPGYPHSGTITLFLDDGTTVSHSQGLQYDSSTSVAPVRSGHQALVYRSVNTAALQSFLDQYWHRTVSYRIDTVVGLQDISSSSETTIVDVQGSAESQLQYIGSGSLATEGGGGPFQKDL